MGPGCKRFVEICAVLNGAEHSAGIVLLQKS